MISSVHAGKVHNRIEKLRGKVGKFFRFDDIRAVHCHLVENNLTVADQGWSGYNCHRHSTLYSATLGD